MKTVLCVCADGDEVGVSMVEEALRARGARPLRFELDRFPTEGLLHATLDQEGYRGFLENRAGERVELQALDAIWFRRMVSGMALPDELDPGLRRACLLETEATALGVLAALPCRTIDPPQRVIRAENKAWQLAAARRVGLPLPETIISNSAEGVRAAAAGAPPLVTKMLSASEVQTLRGAGVVQTSALSAEDLEDLSGLDFAPVTLQHRVTKALEARAVVVGEQVFAAGVDSQQLPGAQVDWRREIHSLMPLFRPVELPAAIRDGLVALNARMGLRYGSADLILTPEGDWVFLEMNPGGEWSWIQRYAGFDVAGALADALLEDAA